MPEVLRAVISLSAENLPSAMSIETKKAIGIVNISIEGKRKIISLAIVKMLIPLLKTKSMIWRIFPISRTKVKTNKMIIKGKAISLNIYRLIILCMV